MDNELLKPIKWYAALNNHKGRKDMGLFLLEGERAISLVMGINEYAVIELLILEGELCPFRGISTRTVTLKQMREISDSVTAPKIIAVVKMPENVNSETLPDTIGRKILLLEDIQDPGNCGTLIRTASAFGYSGVIMSDKCADPFSRKCLQSTAGTIYSLWIRRTSNYLDLVTELKKRNYTVFSSDMDGIPVTIDLFRDRLFILSMCNEGNGMSKDLEALSDTIISLKMDKDKAESLNVAMCGSIMMYLSND